MELFQHTFSQLSADGEAPDEGLLEGFLLETAWTTVSGRRKTRALANLLDPEWRVILMTIAIVVEPMRRLTSFFMKVSHMDISAPSAAFSPAMNCINPRASMIWAALSYLSSVLEAPQLCSRLCLIFSQRGCVTFAEWQRKFPSDIERLRKALLAVHSSTWRREYWYLRTELEVFSVGDMRFSAAERESIAKNIITKRSCCLRPGVSREFVKVARTTATQRRGPAADCAILSIEDVIHVLMGYAFTLHCIALFISLSTACVEAQHAVNRCLSLSGCCHITTLSATSLLNAVRSSFSKFKGEHQKNGRVAAAEFCTTSTSERPFGV